jgi:hypothetical protein
MVDRDLVEQSRRGDREADGVRVVVQTAGYATTSAQHQAELQAIVDSIKIKS